MLLCTCGSEPEPTTPTRPSPPPPASTPEPEPEPELELELEPDVPPDLLPVDERCRINVEGGPRLVRAAVRAGEGNIRRGDIEDGHTVGYDCPEESDRKGVDLIAQLENQREPVHWSGITVGADKSAKVASSDNRKGLPPGIQPEEVELLDEQGIEILDAPATEAAAGPPAEVPVTFLNHQFFWIQIQIRGRGRRPLQVTLNGKKARSLVPGRYEVMARTDPEDEWESAGPLRIEADKSYVVKFFKRPLRLKVIPKDLAPSAE